MTTWYGKTASKQMESLVETRPRLSELFSFPEFIAELKAYNTKLLEYITNTPSLLIEALTYLTISPKESDSPDRKFKFPLLAIEMIESDTTCILNLFFKEVDGSFIFDRLFTPLQEYELLPMLASYLFRVHTTLVTNRCKQAIERFHLQPKLFQDLIRHAHHSPITNVIMLYLNMDTNKSPPSTPERLQVKMETLRSIVRRISAESRISRPDSNALVDNLINVLIELIDKYYMILDGKQMMDVVVTHSTVQAMLDLMRGSNQLASSAFRFFIAMINYYSFLSITAEDGQSQDKKTKGCEHIENAPLISLLCGSFSEIIDRVTRAYEFKLGHYRLLQVYCHCISISSRKILRKMQEMKFFQQLVNLMFRHEKISVLHMLIKKSFTHIFTNNRPIYVEYKRYLFESANIIEFILKKILQITTEGQIAQTLAQKHYYGHLMSIIVLISSQTDKVVLSALEANGQKWDKVNKLVVLPYKEVCSKSLGSYQTVPSPKEVTFTVAKDTGVNISKPVVSSVILEIEKEENSMSNITNSNLALEIQQKKHKDCTLNSVGLSAFPDIGALKEIPIAKPLPFKEFLSKKKEEVESEILMMRSRSQDRQNVQGRRKMLSPSPQKQNSWVDLKTIQKSISNLKDNSSLSRSAVQGSTVSSMSSSMIPLGSKDVVTPLVKLPLPKKDTTRVNRLMTEGTKPVNMEQLLKIKVYRIEAPRVKRYRQCSEKDSVILEFLGIAR